MYRISQVQTSSIQNSLLLSRSISADENAIGSSILVYLKSLAKVDPNKSNINDVQSIFVTAETAIEILLEQFPNHFYYPQGPSSFVSNTQMRDRVLVHLMRLIDDQDNPLVDQRFIPLYYSNIVRILIESETKLSNSPDDLLSSYPPRVSSSSFNINDSLPDGLRDIQVNQISNPPDQAFINLMNAARTVLDQIEQNYNILSINRKTMAFCTAMILPSNNLTKDSYNLRIINRYILDDQNLLPEPENNLWFRTMGENFIEEFSPIQGHDSQITLIINACESAATLNSYRARTKALYDIVLSQSLNPQFQEIWNIIEKNFSNDTVQDELFTDYKLFLSLHILFWTIQLHQAPGQTAGTAFRPIYLCSLLTGDLDYLIEGKIHYMLQCAQIILILQDIVKTRMRTLSDIEVPVVVAFVILKLKTLLSSHYLNQSYSYNPKYSMTVLRYLFTVVCCRALDAFDFCFSFLMSNQDEASGAEQQMAYNLGDRKINVKDIPGYAIYHVGRLQNFAKSRNNLLQELPSRLESLQGLFKRHLSTQNKLRQIRSNRSSIGTDLLQLPQLFSQQAFSSNFDKLNAEEFWTGAFALMQALSENKLGMSGKIRFMEILFLDWGTFRYLTATIQQCELPTWNSIPGNDNFALLYGPCNALIFYGLSMNPIEIYPEIDESTLAYDIRNAFRPLSVVSQDEISFLRSSLVDECIRQTTVLLSRFTMSFALLNAKSPLKQIDIYAKQRYDFLLVCLYVLEFINRRVWDKTLGDSSKDDNQLQSLRDQSQFLRLNDSEEQQITATALVLEATTSQSPPSDYSEAVDQVRLADLRRLQALKLVEQSSDSIDEQLFYLNWMQSQGISAMISAIYTSFVKSSLHSKDSLINLSSPLLLANTWTAITQACERLTEVGVLKLFDLQNTYYSRMKYRILSDDIDIFLSSNRRNGVLAAITNGFTSQPQQLMITNQNLMLALNDNADLRKQIIQQLQNSTNQNLADLSQRIASLSDQYDASLRQASEIQLQISRAADVQLLTTGEDDLLRAALTSVDSSESFTLKGIDDLLTQINQIIDNVTWYTTQSSDIQRVLEKITGDVLQFLDSVMPLLQLVTLNTRDLLANKLPLLSSVNTITKSQMDVFSDLYFQRITAALKTRLSLRSSLEFRERIGTMGLNRLNLILSDQTTFNRTMIAVVNTNPSIGQAIADCVNSVRNDLNNKKNIENIINSISQNLL